VAQYLTYAQYQAWGGTLDESAFNLAEIKARSRIDALTQRRVAYMQTVPEQVQAAMMEIITVDQTYSASAQASSPVAASFSTDGYSESYGSAESRTAAIEKQLTASILTLLDGVLDDYGTPLTFAGVPTAGDGWIGAWIP
jgi:hypothetical protein